MQSRGEQAQADKAATRPCKSDQLAEQQFFFFTIPMSLGIGQ